jgi:hypothetical protein
VEETLACRAAEVQLGHSASDVRDRVVPRTPYLPNGILFAIDGAKATRTVAAREVDSCVAWRSRLVSGGRMGKGR